MELLLDNGADSTVGRLLEAAAHRNDEKGLQPLHKRGIRGSQVLASWGDTCSYSSLVWFWVMEEETEELRI